MGTSRVGHQGLCTIIILLTDISQDPKCRWWKPSCLRLQGRQGWVGKMVTGDTDDTQGDISRLRLNPSVPWGRTAVIAGGSCQQLCVKLPVLPVGFV